MLIKSPTAIKAHPHAMEDVYAVLHKYHFIEDPTKPGVIELHLGPGRISAMKINPTKEYEKIFI